MKDKAPCAAVVVTYYPDKDALRHITTLCDQCQTVILIDNSHKPDAVSLACRRNLIIHRNGSNKGLAYALNKGIVSAHEAGLDNVFLFDQDSRVSPTYFRKMLDFKRQVDSVYDRCAFYVPNFYDRNSRTHARFPIIRPLSFRHVTCGCFNYAMGNGVLIAITSGMLINYQRYLKIGPFQDDYFIDFIDNEYCLKAGTKGLSVAVNCNVTLDHAIGNRKTYKIIGLSIKPNYHPPFRRYCIARNGLRTALAYSKDYPSFIFLIGLRFVHEVTSITFFEKKRNMKLWAFLLGCWHGIAKSKKDVYTEMQDYFSFK